MSELNATSKRNILQIVPSLNCGGVERGTVDIAKALSENGYMSFVLSSGGNLASKIAALPYSEHIKHNVSSRNPFNILRNVDYIKNLILQKNINLVHARSRAPAWSAYLACKKLGLPFITTFHGIYNNSSSLKKYYNSIMAKGDKVIAVSEFVKNHIITNYDTDPSKIKVIYRGVDLEYFNPKNFSDVTRDKLTDKYHIPKSVPVILVPSRFTAWKGQNIMIKALAELKKMDFYCLLVGDLSKHPNYVNYLNNLIRDLKLQSKVQIFGAEPDIAGLYDRADIVVSSSIEPEAFGRTIVEAQAMSKLVVATNIGGAAETVENDITGFHALPKNPESMANVLGKLLPIVGTSKADEIGSAARSSVIENFSLQKMQTQTLDLYSEFLK